MQSNCLFPLILSPTRVATVLKPNGNYETTEKILDNIFFNTQNPSQSGLIETSITDHYPIFLILSNRDLLPNDEHAIIKYRNISDNTIKHFLNTITSSKAIRDIYNQTNAKYAFTKQQLTETRLCKLTFICKS